MKKPNTFRPSLSDVLEDRIVLSTAHAAVVHHAIQPFQGNNLGAIQGQVNAAFNSFAQDYTQAQSAYLAGASTNPQSVAGLKAFVANRIGSLVGQLNGIVGSMKGGSLSTASMLTGALAGTNLGTLQQRLQAITPVGTNGQTAASFASRPRTRSASPIASSVRVSRPSATSATLTPTRSTSPSSPRPSIPA